MGYTFFIPAYGTEGLGSLCGSAEWEGQGGSRPGHISRAGGGWPLQVAGHVRAGQPARVCACAPGHPAAAGELVGGPSLPPPRAGARICRCAPRAPSPPTTPPAYCVTPFPPVIHSARYWYPLNLSKNGYDSFNFGILYTQVAECKGRLEEPVGTLACTRMYFRALALY